MHHNWWNGVQEATHQIYHGQVHYLNNYWSDVEAFIIALGNLANVFTENGVVEGGTPYIEDLGQGGALKDVGTTGGDNLDPDMVTLTPSEHYPYTATPTDAVKAEVMANAGAGKISL